MKKRTITTLLVILMVMTTLVGCQEKEPVPTTKMEIYEAINKNMEETMSYYAKFDGIMNMSMESLDSENPIPTELMGILQNIAFTGDFEIRQVGDNFEFGSTYKTNMNGLSTEMEMYYDGATLLFKYPMFGENYFMLSLEDIVKMVQSEYLDNTDLKEMDTEELLKTAQRIMVLASEIMNNSMKDIITEDDFELLDTYNYMDGEKEISSKTLKIVLDSDLILESFEAIIDGFKNSEEFYKVVKDIYPNEDFTFEFYQEALNELDMNALDSDPDFESFKSMLESLNYIIYLGYNDEFMVNYMQIDYGFSMVDSFSGFKTNADLIMNMVMTHHNEIRKVHIPVVREGENGINLFETLANPNGLF